MPRKQYREDDRNKYSPPKEKPPRWDCRKDHDRVIDDPVLLKEKQEQREDMRVSDQEYIAAKKIAKKMIKKAEYKDIGYNIAREKLESFKPNEDGLKALANTYNHIAKAFSHMVQASNTFANIKSSRISPDGRIGGYGFVQPIKGVRTSMSNLVNTISELIDTFHDELNSPHLRKTTTECHPIVQSILNEADQLLDKAEDEKKEIPKESEKKEVDKKEMLKDKLKEMIS